MTTAQITIDDAIGQLKPHLSDDFLRTWRKVTLALGYRQVGKALSALAPKAQHVKSASPAPTIEDSTQPEPTVETLTIAETIDDPVAKADFIEDCTPKAQGTWLIKKLGDEPIWIRAYWPCAEHAQVRADLEKIVEATDGKPERHHVNIISDTATRTLVKCDACKEATRHNANLLAREMVSHMKGPGITYRGKGIWNKPIPRNKAGGLSVPNPGGLYG